MGIVEELAEVLRERRHADPEASYVASLYARGAPGILEKVAEEAGELAEAARAADPDAAAIVRETADLWFHTLVLLAHLDIHPAQVLAELERRFGISGHEEKAAREK